MLERCKKFFTRPTVLFALLLLQIVLYWMLTIYLGSQAVPVAYQRF